MNSCILRSVLLWKAVSILFVRTIRRWRPLAAKVSPPTTEWLGDWLERPSEPKCWLMLFVLSGIRWLRRESAVLRWVAVASRYYHESMIKTIRTRTATTEISTGWWGYEAHYHVQWFLSNSRLNIWGHFVFRHIFTSLEQLSWLNQIRTELAEWKERCFSPIYHKAKHSAPQRPRMCQWNS